MHLWLCAPTGKLRCDAAHNIRRDIESPSYEAIPIRATAESAFQMLFLANEGKARLARLCSCRKGTAKQVGTLVFDAVLTTLPLK